MNFRRRIRRLEEAIRVNKPKRIQLIVTNIGEPGGFQNCTRRLHDGILTETVNIGGNDGDITDEAIQRFIDSHPITDAWAREVVLPKLAATGQSRQMAESGRRWQS